MLKMSSDFQILFERDSVYIHSTQAHDNADELIAGQVYLVQRSEGVFIEWRAEDRVYSLDGGCENEWNVVSSVTYRSVQRASSGQDTDHTKEDDIDSNKRRFNVCFNLFDLKCFKRNAPSHGWAFIIFILKDGTTYAPLHFHDGGSRDLLKQMEKFVQIKRSTAENGLFIVQEHDRDMLSQSFDELHLFADTSSDLVSKFIRDPYTTTLGGFSKVTNFIRGVWQPPDMITDREDISTDFIPEEIPGMEINQQDEPGYEVVTKTKLPNRPEVIRGEPLTAQQWSMHMNSDGQVTEVDAVKQIIFRGGVDSAIRIEIWKFLLGLYEWDSTYKTRTESRKRKVDDYFRMKLQWKTISEDQEKRFCLLRDMKNLIDKDVKRTDRNHHFFLGDRNPNLQVLYDILMTYCMFNFDLGYVQGMSDLLSPILVVMENEVDAFWCFVGFMELVGDNFEKDQAGMKGQLASTQTLMEFADQELFSYLQSHDSGNFYFCFRWLLIVFKREFTFPDIMRLWEVLWTNLPCKNFHLLLVLSILDSEKTTLMENRFGFTEILKHINDISFTINVEQTMVKGEAIYLQMRKCRKLPQAVKEILGIDKDKEKKSKSKTPSSSKSSTSASSSTKSDGLELPLKSRENVDNSGTTGTTPDDSSIELLSPNSDGNINEFYY